MSDLLVKVDRAVRVLQSFQPENEPYYVCYSGGKDSDCIRILCELSGVKYDLVHNHTTADAPETVRYIRSIPGIHIDYAFYSDGSPKTMWNLIVKKKMPPTRLVRFCCSELKEFGGKGRLKVTGVRASESRARAENGGLVKIISKSSRLASSASSLSPGSYKFTKKNGLVLNFDNSESRRFVESCYRTANTLVNPILDWSESDVWEFLHHYGCSSNPLYSCGFKRVGCIGCPISSKRVKEFELYPKFKSNYIRAFDRMLKVNDVPYRWKTGYEVFQWWIGETPGQMSFFDEPSYFGGVSDG